MIQPGAAEDYNIWSHSRHIRELYRARARDAVEEMTCAAQAAEILATLSRPGERLFDAGCGSGWFYHSLRRRRLELEYWGMDRTAALIAIGREELPAFGLPPERLLAGWVEYASGSADHVLCMNVLTNLDNWHRPLERLTAIARRSLVLRESLQDTAAYAWVPDRFLDPGVALSVHVNTYSRAALTQFLTERGFQVRMIEDRRTGGQPELVIGYPHYWTFLVAERLEFVP
jgi:SAM-dependent methyltransferase